MPLFIVASSDTWLRLIYQSLVLTNIQNIIAGIKWICLSFFIASVVGYLPSSTQNNIVARDYPLAWLLNKFEINLLIVGLRIHSPLRNVVMDSCISWKICSCALARGWLFLAAPRSLLASWRSEPGPWPLKSMARILCCEHPYWRHVSNVQMTMMIERVL